MSRDNRDRYGYRHRQDPEHGVGDSMPGDVGDSKGTFHDRARQDSNIIVDGEVQSIESHKRSTVEANKESQSRSSGSSDTYSQNNSGDRLSQEEAVGKVVTLTVDSHGGTKKTLGHFRNHQVHIEGGTPGEEIRVRLEAGSGYLVGRRVSTRHKS